jgi:hypothetical protein
MANQTEAHIESEHKFSEEPMAEEMEVRLRRIGSSCLIFSIVFFLFPSVNHMWGRNYLSTSYGERSSTIELIPKFLCCLVSWAASSFLVTADNTKCENWMTFQPFRIFL